MKNDGSLYCFDFDGVVSEGNYSEILKEKSLNKAIITGRCLDESSVIYNYLKNNKIMLNFPVYFNPILLKNRGDKSIKSRVLSAIHKVNILKSLLLNNNFKKVLFFEDDTIQYEIILNNFLKIKKFEIIKIESSLKL